MTLMGHSSSQGILVVREYDYMTAGAQASDALLRLQTP